MSVPVDKAKHFLKIQGLPLHGDKSIPKGHAIPRIMALILRAWNMLKACATNHSARSKKKKSHKCPHEPQLPNEPAWLN